MTNELELEQKMNEWAETFKGGKFKRWRGSATLKSLYVKHNMPKRVADCVEGSPAKLTLLITNKYDRRDMELCRNCFRKECDCDDTDMIEYTNLHSYKGGDESGEIALDVAPFDLEKVPELEEDEVYVITGLVSSWNDKMRLSIKSAEREDEAEAPATITTESKLDTVESGTNKASKQALKECKEAFELFGDKVPEAKWNQVTGTLSVSDLKAAMFEMHIRLVDGYYTRVE